MILIIVRHEMELFLFSKNLLLKTTSSQTDRWPRMLNVPEIRHKLGCVTFKMKNIISIIHGTKIFDHNFGKWRLIFKTLSLAYSYGNPLYSLW